MKFRKDTPIIYLSGFFSSAKKGPTGKRMSLEQVVNYWRKKSGAKNRCYAFPYVGDGGFCVTTNMKKIYANAIEHGDGILMDSGAHSFHNFVKAETGKISSKKRQKMGDVEELRDSTYENYLKFIKKDGKKWDMYVNFDYTHDPEECYRMQTKFWDAGVDPMPVFHGGPNTLEYFIRYAKDGAKIIGLGTGGVNDRKSWDKKRVYYDLMFNLAAKYNVKIHGFAATHLSMMFMYPWYSVDSATWAKCSAYGKLIFPDVKRNTMRMIHVSDHSLSKESSDLSYNKAPKDMKREIERQINDYGFDLKIVRKNLIERYCFNAAIFAKHVHTLREVVEGTRARWKSLL